MGTTQDRRERDYWLGLSLAFGLSLSVFGFVQGIWLWTAALAFLVFIVIQAWYYGQIVIGRNRFSTATPGVGLLATVFWAGAFLLRGSSIAGWAVPLLSLAGFVAAFWFLSKYGKFHRKAASRPTI